MDNRRANFNNDGDVINGDKVDNYYYMMNFLDNESTYKMLSLKDDYNEKYRSYILKFEELRGYAFSLFFPRIERKEYEFTGRNLVFGKKIIQWVYGFGEFPNKEISKFYDNLKIDFGFDENTLIVKRWNANSAYFEEDFGRALDGYYGLLAEVTERGNIPDWYKDDICVDGRNLIIMISNSSNSKMNYNNVFQLELDKNNHKLAYPDIDRIKVNLYEEAAKHVFNAKNKSKYTTIYGMGIQEIFEEIQNFVFLTIFYGSITHLRLVRKAIADIMYMYTEIFEDDEILNITLKMQFLAGKFKEFRNLYNKIKLKKPYANSEKFIRSLLESQKALLNFERSRTDIFIFDLYGRYLDENEYINLEKKVFGLIEISENIQISYVNEALKSILSNVVRLKDIDKLMHYIIDYIHHGYSGFYLDLIPILNNINVEKLSEEMFSKFQHVIDLLLEYDRNYIHKLSYSVVEIKKREENIDKYDDSLFSENSVENFLYMFDDELYTLKHIIRDFKMKHDASIKSRGVYSEFANEYRIGDNLFEAENYRGEVRETLINEYLPLAKAIILSDNEIIYEKIKHIKSLAHILVIEKDLRIKKSIMKAVNASLDIDSPDFRGIGEVKKKDNKDLEVNIMMCNAIYDNNQYSKVLSCYLKLLIGNEEYGSEISTCLLLISDFKENKDANLLEKMYILFCMLYKIDDVDVRNSTLKISKEFIGTCYQEEIVDILKARANEIIFGECDGYISLLKNIFKENREVYYKIGEILKNHRCYSVRYIAETNL